MGDWVKLGASLLSRRSVDGRCWSIFWLTKPVHNSPINMLLILNPSHHVRASIFTVHEWYICLSGTFVSSSFVHDNIIASMVINKHVSVVRLFRRLFVHDNIIASIVINKRITQQLTENIRRVVFKIHYERKWTAFVWGPSLSEVAQGTVHNEVSKSNNQLWV